MCVVLHHLAVSALALVAVRHHPASIATRRVATARQRHGYHLLGTGRGACGLTRSWSLAAVVTEDGQYRYFQLSANDRRRERGHAAASRSATLNGLRLRRRAGRLRQQALPAC